MKRINYTNYTLYTMEKPSHWFMKTGCLLPNEKFNQLIHNHGVNYYDSSDWKHKLKMYILLRNRRDNGTLFYSETEIDQLWKEAVDANKNCMICFEKNDHTHYMKCEFGHVFHSHCPGFSKSNTYNLCPLCKQNMYISSR